MSTPRTSTGRWTERSQAFARKIDAERFLTNAESSKLRGAWIDPALGRTSLGSWAERWLQGREHGLKPKSAECYRSLLRSRILPAFGSWDVAAIKPSDVERWMREMQAEGLSASRIRQAHVTLSLIMKSAVRDGLVTRDPTVGVDLPRLPHAEAAYLEPGDVERIASAMRAPYDLMVRIMGALGPRYGETAALRRRSVDLLRRRLLIAESLAEVGGRAIFGETKTHAIRRVPLTPSLAAALKDRLDELPADPDALVFPAPMGGPLRHSAFYHRLWRPALAVASMPAVGVHVLRHSAAAALIASGASTKAVQVILGHRSAAFTLTVYGHLFDADLDDVAARLDETLARGRRDPDGTHALAVLPAQPRKGL